MQRLREHERRARKFKEAVQIGQEGDAYERGGSVLLQSAVKLSLVNTPVAPGSVSCHYTGARAVEGRHREGKLCQVEVFRE